jgi:hypothetical protein
MTHYVLTIYQPDGPPPAAEVLDPIMRDLDALRREMQDAGVWVFGGGLHQPSTATVLRRKGNETLTTDGPYVEGKEHVGGFDIIDVPDLDEALAWGRKLAEAIALLPIEVRPFSFVDD